MKILLIEDNDVHREHFRNVLERVGHEVKEESSAEDALALDPIEIKGLDIAIIDMRLPGIDGLQAGKKLREKNQFLNTIMLTAFADVPTAVRAMKESGFYDYVEKQKGDDALLEAIGRISKSRAQYPPDELFIGVSPMFRQAIETANRAAPSIASVLILGERGTGKELMAKYIHKKSNRDKKDLVSFDCGAVTETVEGDELFGHKKGAFTGAVYDRKGLFQQADGGTLFMDEIGKMSKSLQKKLSRALQEKRIKRIGESIEIDVDVRLIFATNADLSELCRKDLFDQDLYDRMKGISIIMPPLRERKEDISLLAEFFVRKYNTEYNHTLTLADEAHAVLNSYNWPGNIRELQKIMESAVVLTNGIVITASDLRLPSNSHSTISQTTGASHNYKWSLAHQQLHDMQKKFNESGTKLEVAKIVFPDAENPLNALHGFFKYEYVINYFVTEKRETVEKELPDILNMIVKEYKAVIQKKSYPDWIKQLQ